ncbi:MAG: arginine--tRNA ligase, partial [Acidobacteriaceae bacterium]|nr:arginine--tRNA ligase [Acidobacteriaceae bacterium]
MFHEIEARLSGEIGRVVAAQLGLEVKVTLEQPRDTSFGDMAIPLAFQLARQLKRAPKQIAAELLPALSNLPGVASLEVAGNGYINVRLDRGAYAESLLAGSALVEPSRGAGGKIVVEHTNINPNKAAHIGHLRNAILGDTFVRMLRKRGNAVEVQNYIDNTGVQLADVVAAFHYLEGKNTADVEVLINDEATRFDYLCWDLYARISAHYEKEPAALAWRTETLHAIESGDGDLAALGRLIADRIVAAHLATMCRIDVEYELLPRESEILHLKFWATAFELLKERRAIYLETQGKNAGCWVMPSTAFKAGGGGEAGGDDDSKVIVRSNGTITYVGKDIDYQLWKFGLLGKDFFYREWSRYPDGHQVWVTTDRP